ncbi:MAG: metal-dependent transcriptional regulator [Chloroflexi bacterium]|nr:metal-dependent transcriptional regulator [Chloroflexota bacterium]
MPTIPTENYLIAIQTLHDEGIRCIPARIAEMIEVSAPTVTEAIKRMKDHGYVMHLADREIDLTEEGRAIALSLMRRHRMVERWLTDVLGLDWASAHEEAHRLEHAVSDVVAERLWSSMGRPDSCPHGNPIRDPDAHASVITPIRLRDVESGRTVALHRISELAEDKRELMTFLERMSDQPSALSRREEAGREATAICGCGRPVEVRKFLTPTSLASPAP